MRFAAFALRVADYLCSAEGLQSTYDAVTDILQHPDVDAVRRATVDMIYHAACGNLDISEAAARAILAARREGDSPAALSVALRSAAYVYKRCGELDEALRMLMEAAKVAEANNLVNDAVLSYGFLGDNYVHLRDLTQARAWLDRCSRWIGRTDNRGLLAMSRVLHAKIALLSGRVHEIEPDLIATLHSMLHTSDLSRRVDAQAVQLHALVIRGEVEIPASLISEFEATFHRVWTFGEQDYPAYILYLVHSQRAPAAALEALREYVDSRRRERGPVPTLIASVLQ
jgi:tetratricopeptide (TPR) repeat protein